MSSRLADIDQTLWRRGAPVGLPEGAALAWALREGPKTLLMVPSSQEAKAVAQDLRALEARQEIFLLEEPPLESQTTGDQEALLRRGAVMSGWRRSSSGLLIATPGGLLAPFRCGQEGLVLAPSRAVGRDALVRWLSENGYRRKELVWEPGDFAVRGGIVDLYDPSEPEPLRVEFFDEEIASLRTFQPRTQRSYGAVELRVLKSVNRCGRQENPFQGQSFDALLLEPRRLERYCSSFCDLWNQLAPPPQRIGPEAFERFLLESLGPRKLRLLPPGEAQSGLKLPLEGLAAFRGDLRRARAYLQSMARSGFEIRLYSHSVTDPDSFGVPLKLFKASLSSGFLDSHLKALWMSDTELFGVQTVDDGAGVGAMPQDLEESLRPGQWVVHESYGVCKVLGTSSEDFGGHSFETLVLEFAGEKRLIIPFSDLYRLSPWTGEEEPKADQLGSKHWKNLWRRAEAQIEADAQQLLEIYAAREVAPGRSFGPDGPLMERFEASFPYLETRDQLKAIADVKRDMESPWPMDRLVVGDVGYGKTEVVLRAAVKAIENGAQVALIAPTTVLAQQHYRTCLARIGDLPLRVELLSRMVSPAKQKRLLADLGEGKIDLVIGTHRIFQGDVPFRDLGLLIIDEEHRFGVRHKEAMKAANPNLDVIVLSATPIPRSLAMALRGVRDLSLIATPPRSRGEVFTVTAEWSPTLVYGAVERELHRGGQVYYLHNRVEDIDRVAQALQQRFPEATVAKAHGQMKEQELEGVMTAFYEGAVQILVCTTIIESGLDVARANTLIVDDVRRLGLAQMHQIRGRIGRRSENGYALFLYPSDGELPGTTRERLEALGATTSQNSGYRLAQRDLEIRGAGDVLGLNQHGFRERIGYGLYFKKLRQRVQTLREGQAPTVAVDLQMPLAIPQDYLPQMDLRIGLYRRLDRPITLQEYLAASEELRDRYGPLPEALQALLDLALIRGEGASRGLRQVSIREGLSTLKGLLADGVLPQWKRSGTVAVGPGGLKGLHSLAEWLASAEA